MDPNNNNTHVDLNRNLPRLPVHLCLDLPPKLSLKPRMNLETYIPTHQSPMSSSPSNNTKERFQTVTRELLRSSSPEDSPSVYSSSDGFDPVKHSPSSGSMQDTQSVRNRQSPNSTYMSSSHSYGSSRGRSPVIDRGKCTHTLMEEFYEHRCDSPAQFDQNSQELLTSNIYRPKGMSQSRSEGNILRRAPPHRIKTRFDPVQLPETRNNHATVESGSYPSQSSSVRGRVASRTPSPAKLDNIVENRMAEFPPSPIKRSRSPVKQLFGERGWLGRSTSMKELPSEEYRKTGFKHWGGKLKQKVGEISQKTGEVSKRLPTTFAHHETPPKTRSKSKFPISLNPPAQSKLYAEVELMISATANWYLMTQAHAGRMSTDSLTKINSFWTSKNRPQVVEFQFDQLTQHELVQANLKTFRFYGAQAENIITLNAMMISWRTMAKEMSVRTFCTPDSVIRKQLHDCYKILEMLGAPVVTFLAFQEIQVRALATMREQQERREKLAEGKFGFEALEGGRRWEVFPAASEPAVVVAAEGVLGGLLENPFD